MGDCTGGEGREAARGDIARGGHGGRVAIHEGYRRGAAFTKEAAARARAILLYGPTGEPPAAGVLPEGGFAGMRQQLREGYAGARGELGRGYEATIGDFRGGLERAIQTSKDLYGAAQGRFEAPEMVATRQELYSRILGKGGYSPETLERMKAGAREEYGTAARDLERAAPRFYGHTEAPGMAAETFSRGLAEIGARRANTVRDIDLAGENVRRSEQTQAMIQAQSIALQRSGLDASQATQQASLMADLAHGVASLQEKRTMGLANLTVTEAQQQGALTENETKMLAGLESALGQSLASMTIEEAANLANIYMGQASATAGTRDMTNYFSDALKAVGPAVGAAVGGAIAGPPGAAIGGAIAGGTGPIPQAR